MTQGSTHRRARASGTVATPPDAPNTHACWVFEGRRAFASAAVDFLRHGAEWGERLVYTADRPSVDDLLDDLEQFDEARDLYDAGMLLVEPVRGLYGPDSDRDHGSLARRVSAYRALTEQAVDDGCTGLRVAADATALVGTEQERRHFLEYELAVDEVMATLPMSALCAYDANLLDGDLCELSAVHPQGNVGAANDPGFRFYFDGSVLRFVGEIDLSNRTPYDSVLDAARAVAAMDDRGASVDVDLSALEFIDGAGMWHLNDWVSSVQYSGAPVRVHGARDILRRCADLMDLDDLREAIVGEAEAA